MPRNRKPQIMGQNRLLTLEEAMQRIGFDRGEFYAFKEEGDYVHLDTDTQGVRTKPFRVHSDIYQIAGGPSIVTGKDLRSAYARLKQKV